jgi:hypothetical protein
LHPDRALRESLVGENDMACEGILAEHHI